MVLKRKHDEEKGVPAPGAAQELLAGVGLDEVREVPVLGSAIAGIELVAAPNRTINGIRISQTRPPTRPLRGLSVSLSQRASRSRCPAERSLLASDEDGDEDELPDEGDSQ